MINLKSIEDQEIKMHRIRTKVITFKSLVQKVYDSGNMTYEQWQALDLASQVSDDYNDSLTLNKLTALFSNVNLN